MRRFVCSLALAAVGAVGVRSESAAQQPATQSITLPDSVFQPIRLPPTLSFGYPANGIFAPQIHDLTRRRDFNALEAMFGELASDVARDVKNETRFLDAFEAFNRDEPALLASIDAWIAARPRSAHARVARANYHFATAWRRRGQAYVVDTPAENLAGMREFSEKALVDVNAALERDSTHLIAYQVLIGVTQLFGQHDVASRALVRGVSFHRGSYVLYRGFVAMLWPRWGGSEDVMIKFGDRAAGDAGDNPRLATLRGAVHESRAYDSTLAGNHAGAVRELNKALAFGPELHYLVDRGRAYFRLGAYQYAFNDLRLAVMEQSQNREALEFYGRTLVEIAVAARPAIRPTILDRAIETLTLAAYLEPANAAVKTALDRARELAAK